MKEFTLDFSQFVKGCKKILEKTLPEVAEKAVGVATLQLMNDCILECPTVPVLEGFLRGSGSIFVNNKLAGVSSFGKPGYAAMDYRETIQKGQIVGVCSFSTPYAARLHEGIDFKFTEPSSGPKFLESKLMRNKERYFTIIANVIKKEAK